MNFSSVKLGQITELEGAQAIPREQEIATMTARDEKASQLPQPPPQVMSRVTPAEQNQHENDLRITQEEQQQKRTSPSAPSMRFSHVINIFTAKQDNNPFYPLDQAQNVTISSMIRAKQNASDEQSITQYAAIYEDDAHAVSDDFGFRNIYLNRSVITEYPYLRPHRRLPFIQDIFNAVMNDGCTNIGDESNFDCNFDYLVYTNNDIGLHENFYDTVREMAKTLSLDAFTINRVGIPKTVEGGRLRTGSPGDLDQIYRDINSIGVGHPGVDCFVIHRSVLRNIDMGNSFLGYSGWDMTLHMLLRKSKMNMKMDAAGVGRKIRYKMFFSFKKRLTFHLNGNEPDAWRKAPDTNSVNASIRVTQAEQKKMADCTGAVTFQLRIPRRKSYKDVAVHPYQAISNCAVSFRNARQRNGTESMPSVL